jgi:hypothetical protein
MNDSFPIPDLDNGKDRVAVYPGTFDPITNGHIGYHQARLAPV